MHRFASARGCTWALLLVGLAATGACSRAEDSGAEEKRLTVSGVTYTFPESAVQTFTEPGEGSPFARIHGRNRRFDLIYDVRAKIQRNYQGGDAPLITGVNDHHSPSGFERLEFDGFVVVCRGDRPYQGCGMRIEDAGVLWTITFNRDLVADAAEVRASALKTLREYRGSGKTS